MPKYAAFCVKRFFLAAELCNLVTGRRLVLYSLKSLLMLFFRKNTLTIVGIVVGCVSGFLYWKYVGCNNGTCFIQSNPYRMSAYGALMGGLLFSMFQGTKK